MPATRLKIFISSVQKEFKQIRLDVKAFLLGEQTGVVIRTVSRDLEDLVGKGVLQKVGTTRRSTFYVLARKPDTKRTNKT